MKIESIRELQKSLTYSIYESESGYYQFSLIKSIINPVFFGQYAKLIEYAIKYPEEDFQNTAKRSTDIIKDGLAEIYTEVILTPFTQSSFFDDFTVLMKSHYLASKENIFENMVALQERLDFIEERRSFDSSKNYLIRNLYDGCINELAEFEKRKRSGKTLGYSYGFPLLDKFTDGIQKGTVTRLNAYSNVGKSKFSYHVVNQLLNQKAFVIYFSLEVTKRRVIYNLIANKYSLEMGQVYRQEFDNIDFGELFTKKLEVVDDKYTLDEIVRYTQSRKPDAIIIDFVQNIQSSGKSEYERMTDIAVTLQQLAIRNNIAIFDLSQVSNAGTNYAQGDAIPSKGSGALVASADVGLMLKRDKLDDNRIILNIAKNKFGFNGKSIDYKIDFSKGTFQELGESKSEAF